MQFDSLLRTAGPASVSEKEKALMAERTRISKEAKRLSRELAKAQQLVEQQQAELMQQSAREYSSPPPGYYTPHAGRSPRASAAMPVPQPTGMSMIPVRMPSSMMQHVPPVLPAPVPMAWPTQHGMNTYHSASMQPPSRARVDARGSTPRHTSHSPRRY